MRFIRWAQKLIGRSKEPASMTPTSSTHLPTRTIVDGVLVALVRREAACRVRFRAEFAGPTGSLVQRRYLQPQLGI
jgi:hypothetical protein